MRFISPLALLLAAAIHLLPVSGVLGSDALFKLYRVRFTDPNLIIMMRHRAVLFAVIAGLMLAACHYDGLRAAAYGAGFVSAGSFVVLALLHPGYSQAIARVVYADIVVLVALSGGLIAQLLRGE